LLPFLEQMLEFRLTMQAGEIWIPCCPGYEERIPGFPSLFEHCQCFVLVSEKTVNACGVVENVGIFWPQGESDL